MYFIISAAVSLIDIVTLFILKISIKNQVHSKNCKKHQKNGSTSRFFYGANERSRTADLFITNEVLCLLSYVSIRVIYSTNIIIS